MKKIRSIDGIRAIAILMVLLGHGGKLMPHTITDTYIFKLLSNSSFGVSIFFVISGYLITKLLLAEETKNGDINLKNFYIRRFLRITPVLYLYLIVILILKQFFVPDIFDNYFSVIFAALYLWNYIHLWQPIGNPGNGGSWFFGHFWSLSMEEQFYLLWPMAIKKLNRGALIKLVLALILLMPLVRIATYFLMPGSRGQIGMMLHTGGDTILMGCLGALLEGEILANKIIKRIFDNKFLILLVFLIFFIPLPPLDRKIISALNMLVFKTITNLVILFLLLWSIHRESFVSKILNTKVMIFIGILSYSLYIWQQLFLTSNLNFWTNKYPQVFVVIFVVAMVSYFLVEKPILRLKERFKVKVNANKELTVM